MSPSYLVFMAIAGVLAAVALLTDSIPVLIGAMIVAPAYPPLALVSLALAAGQPRVALRGLGCAASGIVLAVACAIATTWFLNVTEILPDTSNLVHKSLIEERVRPGWYSAVAAAAAGIAGMIGTIKNKTDTLIGTVASLALVPAGGAAGIALISGDPIRAFGGLVLLLINVGLIIAMGLLVVVVAGRHYMTQEDTIASADEHRRAS